MSEQWAYDPAKKEGRYGPEHDLRINGPDGVRIATLYPATVAAYEADGTPYPTHRWPVDPAVHERGRLMAAAPDLLAVCKAWSAYFAKLEAESDPEDRLAQLRDHFHAERVKATRAAIAKAEKTNA